MSNELEAAAQRLAAVLTQENDALKRLDFSAAIALVQAKEAALLDLTNRSGAGPLAPPLVALGRRLNALAAENQGLLERAIAVQTRIARIVARACKPPPGVARCRGQVERTPSNHTVALAFSTRA